MKKSICIEKIFLELPWERRFAAVKEAGFDYVEFWSWMGKDIGQIKRLLKDNGLRLASFSGDNHFSMINPEHREGYLQYLRESLDIARELDCTHLVMHSNAVDENGEMQVFGDVFSETTMIGASALALSEGARMAEKAGVTLVLEAINTITKPGYFMCSTRQTGDLARIIASPNVKILYDTFHMQQMEGNMIATLRAYRDVLGYIHIGDVPERFEPGTGEINFTRLKTELAELGYTGIVGFELVPRTTSDECARILGAF